MLNYVNPMAMNTAAMSAAIRISNRSGCAIRCREQQELARDLNIDPATLRYRCAGINHMAFYLKARRKTADGSYVNLYPELLAAYEAGQAPKPNIHGECRYQNIVRYEIFKKLGYVSKWSEHFAEYTPWFIKPGREDLIERYKVPLDRYRNAASSSWRTGHKELEEYKNASGLILNRHGNMPAQS